MKIALCMFKYFPFGGLSRDLVKITKYLISKNHYVEIFVQEWDGEIIRDSKINIISCHSLTNHGRAIEYCTKLKLLLQNNNFDITIGFNKIPNLDFYYAADTCFLEKLYSTKSKVEQILYKATRRYKIFSTLERTVFSKNNHTKILFIDKSQVEVYRKYYKFGNDKYIILPPSLSIENLEVVPIEKRKAITIVQVGSDFKRKGVDRSLKAIASLPIELQNKIQFLIIGEGDKTRYNEYISKHRLDSIVKFLGPLPFACNEISKASLLLHPAYSENTGTVILESLYLGTPVITTQECGYSHYVSEYDAGIVISSPFEQKHFNEALLKILVDNSFRNKLSMNALHIRKLNFGSMEHTFEKTITSTAIATRSTHE